MTRKIKVAAAQMGPIHLISKREDTIQSMILLLQNAASQQAQLILFPETAFTTFFPRHLIPAQEELDKYFEHGDDIITSSNTKALFDEAKKLKVDISVGYAERTADGTGYNTSVYYSSKADKILSKYRKIHLPGTVEPFENPDATNQLEKRYFKPGNLGFEAFRVPNLIPDALKAPATLEVRKGDPILGMMICNDRRWAEAWRVYGLQGVELVLCGYNTCGYAPDVSIMPLSL